MIKAETIKITDIKIDRVNRQRREINVEDLVLSIGNYGVLQPVIIDAQNNLIAGERRTAACMQLGIMEIPFVRYESLDPIELQAIELEENLKRQELPWNDLIPSVGKYHRLNCDQDSNWSIDDTADKLGVNPQTIRNYLLVEKHMENELVAEAPKYSVALNVAKRIADRQKNADVLDVMDNIDEVLGGTSATEEVKYAATISPTLTEKSDGQTETTQISIPETSPKKNPERKIPAFIIHSEFREFFEGQKLSSRYNFIHCDFPYGVNAGNKQGMSAAKLLGKYADSKDIYFTLLEYFTSDAFVKYLADSAHLMFWFSPNYYNETYEALSKGGWKVDPFPLIWHKSDNAGIIPDPNRGGRRTYEMAFMGSRGDRNIVRPVANSKAAPTTKEFHTSEKPIAMLEHFFRMFIDETTRMLDPTCGSGNSVIASFQAGAKISLGIEKNQEFAQRAVINLERNTRA